MPRVWKFGDHINTDDILPGKYAPFMVGEDRFHTFAFAHLRPEFAKEVKPGDILVFGRNAGLGSSREYAPEALRKLGIQVVIAKSYARIFFRNLVNLGIIPFESEEVVDALEDGDRVELDLETGVLVRGGEHFALRPPPPFLLEALREGSLLDYYKKHGRFPGE
ncbi:homoaconitate hydratase [Thermus sp. PS18]|uniref:3-isopropylmalate dehydratase small subunit n=1 Tax=Thermus brevis TaxID=2862456 RepID=A0ABS7A295_9DEIN|nr:MULTISPECIES: homoaconitate hydratase [Thermus]MBW6395867.1 homoaconitate hydratase [Thermus brevis]UZX16117.1 homoaconitate hydratase [Thermus sp. PS18]